MKHVLFLLKICFPLALPAWAGICSQDLAGKLQQNFSEKSAHIGIVVAKESDPNPLVDIKGAQSFIPASVMKLFTTAAALQTLGENFQIPTRLHLLQSDRGSWLTIEGGGDPSFSSQHSLPALIGLLSPRGIKHLHQLSLQAEPWGNLHGEGWEWEDLQTPYGAAINGFPIDQNLLSWQVTSTPPRVQFRWDTPLTATGWTISHRAILGSPDTFAVIRDSDREHIILQGSLPPHSPPILGATPVPNPDKHFLQLVRQALEKQGIKLHPTPIGLPPAHTQMKTAFVLLSPPLQQIIREINKESNNFYAEQLLRIIGKATQRPGQTYEDAGKSKISTLVSTPGFRLADGSGLSRHNLLTPLQVVQLLQTMGGNVPFRHSLSIGGVDGTLSQRLSSIKVQAKTGTLRGVASLSGYLTPPHYAPLVFSILINHSQQSSTQLRALIDRLVEIINQIQWCEPNQQSVGKKH